MYEENFKNIINILDKEIKLYTEMRNLYTEKREILVKNNILELSQVDAKIIENYETIKKTDAQRIEAIKTLGDDIPNMSELISRAKELCPKYSLKLLEQQEALNSISSAISLLNLTNMKLIKHGMILTDKKLNIIIEACAPKGNSYTGNGKEETNTLADMLEEMVQDAIAVIPDDSSVEIQEANKSSSAAIYEQLIDKMNAEISKAILGQTLTTEIGSTGSYAASNTHMGIRQDIIDSDKKLVEQTINQLIQWIYEINFSNAEIPVFELYQEEDVDLALAQRDKILFDSGVKFTKEYFIKTYGFDEEDIEIKEDGLPVPMSQYSQFAEEPVIKGQKQIDDLFKFLSEVELNKQSQKMIAPLLSLLETCESYEEAYELLTDKNLHTKQLEQSIQKAMFLCELQGRSDGLDE